MLHDLKFILKHLFSIKNKDDGKLLTFLATTLGP